MSRPPLTNDEIRQIQDLFNDGANIEYIANKTGHSNATVDKYIKMPYVGEKEDEDIPFIPTNEEENIQQPLHTQQQRTPISKRNMYANEVRNVQLHPTQQPENAIVLPNAEIEDDPSIWLKRTLMNYSPPLKPGFINLVCLRARNLGQIPYAANLSDAMRVMDSGVKNPGNAAYIAELYEADLRKYLQERNKLEEYYRTPHGGIDVSRSPYEVNRAQYPGMPMSNPWNGNQYQNPQYNQNYSNYPRMSPYNQQQQSPAERAAMERLAQIEADIKRRDEEDRRRLERELDELKNTIKNSPQMDPTVERLNQKIEQLEAERIRRQEEDMSRLKMQIQQGMGLREQDVLRILESREAKLKPEDVQRMINEAMNNQKSLTELDLQFNKAKDEHALEVMKIQEKSKTRDTIADAVKTGFSQIGVAIAKTASEQGTSDNKQMTGYTDGKNMWQAECPYCNTPITAPLSAKMVICPGCNRRLEVGEDEEYEQEIEEPQPLMQQHEISEPKRQMPEQMQAPPPPQQRRQSESRQNRMNYLDTKKNDNFTIDQNMINPVQASEIKNKTYDESDSQYNEGECIYCGQRMRIPITARKIECPNCKKQLEVGMPIETEIIEPEEEIPRLKDERPVEEKREPYVPPFYGGTEEETMINKTPEYVDESGNHVETSPELLQKQKPIPEREQIKPEPEIIEEESSEEKVDEPVEEQVDESVEQKVP